MPASAAAAKTTGYQIEFGKYPVFALVIIMNPFNEVAASSRKRIFFCPGDKVVEFCQTVVAQTIKKSICQEGLCFITQCNLCAAAGRNIFSIAFEFLFTTGTYLNFFRHTIDILLPAARIARRIYLSCQLIPDGIRFQSVPPPAIPICDQPFVRLRNDAKSVLLIYPA
jgi:hypothetical protein